MLKNPSLVAGLQRWSCLFILFLMGIFILSGCAAGYDIISPSTLEYKSFSSDKDVIIRYKYGLLNKRYTKRELKNEVRFVAIKVTNNSGRDLIFGQDIELIYENGLEMTILEDEVTYKSLRQRTGSYFLYLLFSPVFMATGDPRRPQKIIPIGLIFGSALTLGNALGSDGANKNLKAELQANSIYGKVIKSGDTVTGLVGIRSNSYETIDVKVE